MTTTESASAHARGVPSLAEAACHFLMAYRVIFWLYAFKWDDAAFARDGFLTLVGRNGDEAPP